MKATGIVRRVDDLGRIVIPKEIRVGDRFCRAIHSVIERVRLRKVDRESGVWYNK